VLLVAGSAPSGATGVILIATTGVTAIGVILSAGFGPLSEYLTRRDNLRTYKRTIYRNFLDHAYWCRSEGLSDDKRRERAESYVADWHRIRLIADEEVLAAIAGLREPGSLTAENETPVIESFAAELGIRGLAGKTFEP
jgi:hypothetical protein